MIVADTNLIVYAMTPNLHQKLARSVLLKDPEWHAPILRRSEFRSALESWTMIKLSRQ